MGKRVYILAAILSLCLQATAGSTDSLPKPQWQKITGWHFSAGHTRNNYNSFSADIGRYKTFASNRPIRCAFGMAPLVHRGIGFDYIYKNGTAGYALRLYAQAELLQFMGLRIDFVNCFEGGRYSPKLRPGFGISLGGFIDLHYTYTAGLFNNDVLKQGHGIAIRANINPGLYRRLNPGPSPNYSW